MVRFFVLILLFVLGSGAFAQNATDREARLNRLLADYEREQSALQVPDMDITGTKVFSLRLNSLKNIETELDGLIKTELDELAQWEIDLARSYKSPSSAKVEELHKIYLDSRINYGEAKDYKRYAAFTDLFFESQKLYAEIHPVPKEGRLKTAMMKVKAGAAKFKRLMNLSLRLAVPSLQMLLSAFQKVTKTRIGFGTSVDKFFEQWGKASGISVEVTNREFLANPQRMRIFVPTHRDANLDAVAFAALKTKNPVVFGALNLKNHPIFGMKDHPLVKPMIDSLEKNDTFILAGAQEKPIEKFMRLYREGKVQDVLIYPEGQVGLGMKESRPVRHNFSEAFLKTLVQEGVDFELVPVTYVNGAQFFEYHNDIDYIKTEPAQQKLLVNVQRPIQAEELKRFFETYGEKDFTTYLRMKWLFELETNQDLILGQGRWDHIKAAFVGKIVGGKPCDIRNLERLFAD